MQRSTGVNIFIKNYISGDIDPVGRDIKALEAFM
jgi:hypothetical protein